MAAKKKPTRDASSAAQFRAMEERLRSKKGKAPSGKKPTESLTRDIPGEVRYPVYEISKDGVLQPLMQDKKRVSFIPSDYSQLVAITDSARQNEAIKIINEKGKEEFLPSISIFLLNDEGKVETPYGMGTFLQVPREAITDVQWDEYAQPLSGRDEWEGYNRSKQRAAKKKAIFDLSEKESPEGPMVISAKKGKSFGEMLRGRLS